MKKVILSVFLSVAAGALTISAQLPSLPIGSTNAVLEYSIRQINEVWISVRLLSEDGLSANYIYRQVVPLDAPNKSKAELEELIKRELAIANRDTFAVYGKLYPTRRFLSVYTGIKRLSAQAGHWYILFGTDNEYSLVQNEKGDFVAPNSAYTVDLTAALISAFPLFAEGVARAKLETEDAHGNAVVLEGSGGYNREGLTLYPEDNLVGLPTKYTVSGQPGKVTLEYQNGKKRVYRLQDGTLFPQLEVARKPDGLELTVLGTSNFVIESSQDLKNWESSYLLVPLSTTPPRFLEKNPNGKSFYRLRVTEPAGQRR